MEARQRGRKKDRGKDKKGEYRRERGEGRRRRAEGNTKPERRINEINQVV